MLCRGLRALWPGAVACPQAHEMVGVGGQEARFGCEFGDFFSCADGATPGALLKRGIYSESTYWLLGQTMAPSTHRPTAAELG